MGDFKLPFIGSSRSDQTDQRCAISAAVTFKYEGKKPCTSGGIHMGGRAVERVRRREADKEPNSLHKQLCHFP